MELYKVKIPLDNIDTITGSTVVSGQTIQTGYVKLTKTGDTYVDIFLTSNYDDMGIYTDFDIKEILQFVTQIPKVTSPTTSEGIGVNLDDDSTDSLVDAPVDDSDVSADIDFGDNLSGADAVGSLSTSTGTGGVLNVDSDSGAGSLDLDIGDSDVGIGSIGISGGDDSSTEPKCDTGKLAIATHISSGYTGTTAYVMATSGCTKWTVTGTTSNNMMEILPIAGVSQLKKNVHAMYDANENPIEVTLIYGNPASGATYNIGTGDTKISYNTTDISSLDTNFSFERECCEECYGLNTKEELKMGWVFDPKINVNVFIDRGQNSVFDRFLRLSEVSNNDELLDYNNNYFKVNKQNIV